MSERNEKTPKAMREKLREDYNWAQLEGNLGHAVGFFNEGNEILESRYEFPGAVFTLRSVHEDFIWWNYDAKNTPKKKRIL